jgi:hypothetical protein
MITKEVNFLSTWTTLNPSTHSLKVKYVSITMSKNIVVNKPIYDQTTNQQNFLNMQSIGEVVFYEFEIFH